MIKSRRIRWPGHVAHIGAKRNAYRVLMRKPEGKGPLVRRRRTWENNIKIVWTGLFWLKIGVSGGFL
jgi:hypothetical protein